MLLLTPAEDLRSALLYRTCSSSSSDHPAGSSRPSLIGNNTSPHHHNPASRDSTLNFARGHHHHPDSASICSALPSGRQPQQRHQRTSVVSNTASFTGRGLNSLSFYWIYFPTPDSHIPHFFKILKNFKMKSIGIDYENFPDSAIPHPAIFRKVFKFQ